MVGRLMNELENMYEELTVEYVKEPYWDFPGDTEEKHKKLRS
jgi:hypothetical protein